MGMCPKKWKVLKELKAPEPVTFWNCGNIIMNGIVVQKGKTYRKKEHGLLILPKEQKSC